MNHTMAELATQEADLLPDRLTLGTFGRPVHGVFGRSSGTVVNVITASNFALASRGATALAIQSITAR